MQNPLKKTLFALYVLVIVCMAAATVVEKYSGTDFVRSNVYGVWWFSLLWAVLTAAGIIYFLHHRCKSWSGIALHLSFVVILAGAFVTHVSSERGTVHLRQGAYISTCVMYDRHNQPQDAQMPFQMRLDRFDVQCPLQTLAIDFTKNLYGKASYNGYTPEQVLTGWMFYADDWMQEPMLRLKGAEMCDRLQLPGYVPVSQFFNSAMGGYTLGPYVQEYYGGNHDAFHSQVAAIDNKIQLIMELRNGSLLKLFPYTNKGKTTWFSPTGDLPNAMDREHQQFVRSICLLLSVHVSIIMMSFAMLSFTFISGLTALLLRLVSRTAQPKMVQLQQLSLVFLYPALAALGIGIFIGAIWANVSWGEYWGWDPKEVWALITFMIYAIPLHARSVAQLRRPTAFHLFMTLAFLTLVMTYFGVNYFLGGMHSYA